MTTVYIATKSMNMKTSVGQDQHSALCHLRKEPYSHVRFIFRTKKPKYFIKVKRIQLSPFKDFWS